MVEMIVSTAALAKSISRQIMINGDQWNMAMNVDVIVFNGRIVQFEPGAYIELKEVISSGVQEAVLKDDNGNLQLYIKRGDQLLKANESDQLWLQRFLSHFNVVDTSPNDNQKWSDYSGHCQQFLIKLSRSSKKKRLINTTVNKKQLPSDLQQALVESIFKHIISADDRVDALLSLINNPSVNHDTLQLILIKLDEFIMDDDKIMLLNALVRRLLDQSN